MNNRGFTLIELMIVIAIIGIILAIGLPSYNSYVLRSNRTEALTSMVDLQLAEEKFRMSNNSYYSQTETLTENGLYSIAITGVSGSGYTITATAQGDQVGDEASGVSCTPLVLTVSGLTATKTPAACW